MINKDDNIDEVTQEVSDAIKAMRQEQEPDTETKRESGESNTSITTLNLCGVLTLLAILYYSTGLLASTTTIIMDAPEAFSFVRAFWDADSRSTQGSSNGNSETDIREASLNLEINRDVAAVTEGYSDGLVPANLVGREPPPESRNGGTSRGGTTPQPGPQPIPNTITVTVQGNVDPAAISLVRNTIIRRLTENGHSVVDSNASTRLSVQVNVQYRSDVLEFHGVTRTNYAATASISVSAEAGGRILYEDRIEFSRGERNRDDAIRFAVGDALSAVDRMIGMIRVQ